MQVWNLETKESVVFEYGFESIVNQGLATWNQEANRWETKHVWAELLQVAHPKKIGGFK